MKQGSFVKQYHSLFALIQELSDFAIIGLSLWASLVLHNIHWSDPYTWLCIASTFGFFLLTRYNELYHSWRVQSINEEVILVAKTFGAVFITLLVCSFVLHTTELFSRRVIGTWVLLCLALLMGIRVGVRMYLRFRRSSGRNTRTVAIAGAGPLGLALADSIDQSPWMGIQISGLYDDKLTQGSTVNTAAGLSIPLVGDLNTLRTDAKAGLYDAVYIALPMRAEKQMKSLISDLGGCSINVHYVPDIFTFNLMNSRIRDIAGIPTISVYDSPLDCFGRFFKRSQDLVLSWLILCVIALPMLLIAVAIKLDSCGPVLFKQRRYGLSGDEFWVWKFRSMTTQDNGDNITQATKHDSRVTRLGAFLRTTSLDELPQFFNVLQGTMSIVGPRPHAVAHNELYRQEINDYMLRHIVKPGITGWAQINGWRGETDTTQKMEKRIEFDLDYIRNWSLLLDVKIIVLTIFKGFVNKNAY